MRVPRSHKRDVKPEAQATPTRDKTVGRPDKKAEPPAAYGHPSGRWRGVFRL